MQVFITRPAEQYGRTAAVVSAAGHEPVAAPLMKMVFTNPVIDWAGVSLIAITSRHGAVVLAKAGAPPQTPVLAVGPGTAEALSGAGITAADVAQSSGADLLPRLAARWAGGRIIHLSGRAVSFDLVAAGQAQGLPIERIVGYDAAPKMALPNPLAIGLATLTCAGICFFSPRSAQTFVVLYARTTAKELIEGWTALCISKPIAELLSGVGFGRVRVAKRPSLAAWAALL
jgi:uroporphyrinogen-III synthase